MLGRNFVAATLTLGMLGCAGGSTQLRSHHPGLTERRLASPGSDASGVWDWIFRSSDDQGDLRVEQEEWHLLQQGVHIEGYYDRAVTMMSTDERLFRCNQKLGFTKVTRVRISGQLEGDHIALREVGFEAKPGPCDDGARALVAYVGTLRGGTLALRWGPEAGQTLVRRTDGGNSPLVQTAQSGIAFAADATPANAEPGNNEMSSLPIDGVWEWELHSIDAEGDERLEREEWHILENTAGISGYYDRTVKRTRGDGTFSCNGQEQFETLTRYSITGQRFGGKVTLTEIDYKANPSRCDNALRRLDTYQGQVSDGDNLVLSWGQGNQLLHRKK